MPLDQQPGTVGDVGTARPDPGMRAQKFDLVADGQHDAVGCRFVVIVLCEVAPNGAQLVLGPGGCR